MPVMRAFREQTIHGDIDFPLCVYHNASAREQVLVHHWHNEMEFILLNKGRAVFYIDTQAIDMKAPGALFVRGNQIHGAISPDGSFCEFTSIVFHPLILLNSALGHSRERLLEPFADNVLSLPACYRQDPFGQAVTKNLQSISAAFFDKPPGYELLILSSLYSILGHAAGQGCLTISAGRSGHPAHLKKERIKKTLDYIHAHYREKITVTDMASNICVSPYYFCRLFRELCGSSPIEYLNAYRVERAAHLLSDTDRKILEIAMDCGFSNFSYFIRRFKEIKGCTPSVFRRSVTL